MNSFHERMLGLGWEPDHFTQNWKDLYLSLLQEAATLQNKLHEVVSFVEKLGNENETLFDLNMKLVEENKNLKNELAQLRKT
jgi:predicted RNase H-like nuclease (RuvC/YqgF family)